MRIGHLRTRHDISNGPAEADNAWSVCAHAYAVSLLKPSVANEVGRLIRHPPCDLNVNRVAIHRGCSRWTLLRQSREETGACPKQLIALARILSVLGALRPTRSSRRLRPLHRAERRAVQVWLGLRSRQFAHLVRSAGLPAVKDLLSVRFANLVLDDTERANVPAKPTAG